MDIYIEEFGLAGLFMAFVSSQFLAIGQIILSYLSAEIDPLLVILIGYCTGILLLIFERIFFKQPLLPEKGEYKLIVLYGILHGFAIVFGGYSLKFISPFDLIVIINCNVIFTAIFAWLVFNEVLDIVDILAIILTFVGIFMVSEPHLFSSASVVETDGTWKQTRGSILAFLSSLSVSWFACTNRRILKSGSSAIVFCGFCFVILFSSAACLGAGYFEWIVDTTHIVLALCVGVTSLIAYQLLARALQIESAAYSALANSMDIPTTLLIQIFVLGVVPSLFSGIGAGVAIAGFVILTIKRLIFHTYQLESHKCGIRRKQDEAILETAIITKDYSTFKIDK